MIGMREIIRTARERMKKLGKLCGSRFEGEKGGRFSGGGEVGEAI